MPTITCKHCGQDFEPAAQTLLCPNCQQDVSADVMATLRPETSTPKISKSMLDTDSAQTLLSPGPPVEPQIGESSRTLDSAGKSPLLGLFTSTLKPTDSALESADLSSAIPPRGVATDDKPGDAQDYRLGKKLGSGSFGVVYRAEQIALQRNVALKMLKPRGKKEEGQSEDTKARIKSQRVKDRNEFLREAQFTGKLEHPNIVPVHDIGLVSTESGTGNRPFYVMKEIRGESWQETIKQTTRSDNLDILRRVAEAIAYAHSKKILHCDLKPENVMLGEFGEVLVVDWGQAVDTSRPETFRPGGSPAYISPEMAKFWCDLYLDGKTSSLAVKNIGPQSDVYLLGAMLFEIVASKPPHFGLKGETAHDVMRRAIENQISNHNEWMDDELMTIARHALRIDTSVAYKTVTEFLDALKEYETRHVSIDLRDRAMELLDEAKANNDYDAYGRARFGFEESIEKWEGNDLAKTGLSDARLSCAELALKDQNFDLGIGMLEDPETDQEVTVRKKLVAEKTKRDRRKKLVGFLSVGLVVAGIASTVLISIAGNKTIEAKKEKERLKGDIVELKDEFFFTELDFIFKEEEFENKKEEFENKKEDFENEEVKFFFTELDFIFKEEEFENREEDFIAKELEFFFTELEFVFKQDEFDTLLREEQEKVDKQVELAKQAERLAADAEDRNQLLKYKDRIGKIENAVNEGDYATAKNELEAYEKAKDSIEWARLNLLTHPKSTKFLDQDLSGSSVDSASASLDGKRLVLVSGDQVVIRDSETFDVIKEVEIPGAAVAALSPDGSTLAAGVPGEIGKIVITQNGEEFTLDAPSKEITDLQFSSDGSRLLCVGEVDKKRRATTKTESTPTKPSVDLPNGLEQELMIYESNGGTWTANQVKPVQVLLTFGKDSGKVIGRRPSFQNAEFSRDGERILLTTNTHGVAETSKDLRKSIHVFSLSEGQYQWLDTANLNGIDVAIFADDQGRRVVGCQTSDDGSVLFAWDLDGEQFISTVPPKAASSRTEKLENLDARIRSMKRVTTGNGEEFLLTAGEDKKVALWNLERGRPSSPKYYKGHSSAIDLCTLIPNEQGIEKSQLISIVFGKTPEILKTDLSKFVSDEEVIGLGEESKTLSPTSLFVSQNQKYAVLGHDNAHVTRTSLTTQDGDADKSIEWDVSAWKRHTLSNDYLFAQSNNDEFLRFERQTGALTGVLTRLAQQNQGFEINKFQVSDDGKVALIETDSDRPEFQIWDLTNQVLTKRIDYSALVDSKLPLVKLSADGKYVVAGKVGFAVWSTQPGLGSENEPIFSKFGNNRSLTFPKNPINNVVFYPNDAGECEFAVSWPEAKGSKATDLKDRRPTGRIHVYTKRGPSIERVGRFRVEITGGAFDPKLRSTVPNTFDARMIDGSRYILVRSSESINLLKLSPGVLDPVFENGRWEDSDKVVTFDNAKYVQFSDKNNDVLILNKSTAEVAAVQRWDFATKRTEDLNLVEALKKNFSEFPRDNIVTLEEDADGTVTIQTLITSKNARSRKVYNTLSLKEDFSISALRVLANPSVKYAAMAKDAILTLDCGTIRRWELVPGNGASQLVKPDGVLEGFYQCCQVSPDGSQVLAIQRGSGSIVVIDPKTGNLVSSIESPADIDAEPTAIAWSAKDNSQVAIGFANGAIRIWNVADNGFELDAVQPVAEFGTIKSLSFAEGNGSLLAVLEERKKGKEEGDSVDLSKYAVVYQKRAPVEKAIEEGEPGNEKDEPGDEKGELGIDVAEKEIWSPVVIGYPGGESHIVAGHISADGTRVVTGDNTGHLTLWRTDLLTAVKGGEEKPDMDLIKEQVKQRELLELHDYPSPVRFARFFNNPNNENLVDIISADEGGVNETVNELEIWKTTR